MTECKCCGEECVVNPSELCEGCAKEAAAEFSEIIKRLNAWDEKNPKGRVYPYGPNDVEKQLDLICNDARAALSKFYGEAETK